MKYPYIMYRNLFLRYPDFKRKAVTLSYDDGVSTDIRLRNILNENQMKCTFNINSGHFSDNDVSIGKGETDRLSLNQVKKYFKNNGHEIAVHTYTHPSLDKRPIHSAAYEILKDKEILEEIFEIPIRGMAYPNGTLNDDVAKMLEMTGIVYSRTVESTGKFNLPKFWYKLPATCHHKDEKLMEYTRKFLDDNSVSPILFYLWGHSYEFELDDNWYVIEKFAKEVGNRSDIWYATNIEIYDYVKAFENLVFSVNMKYCKNNSALDVYFLFNCKEYIVKSGETIKL